MVTARDMSATFPQQVQDRQDLQLSCRISGAKRFREKIKRKERLPDPVSSHKQGPHCGLPDPSALTWKEVWWSYCSVQDKDGSRRPDLLQHWKHCRRLKGSPDYRLAVSPDHIFLAASSANRSGSWAMQAANNMWFKRKMAKKAE